MISKNNRINDVIKTHALYHAKYNNKYNNHSSGTKDCIDCKECIESTIVCSELHLITNAAKFT